ncbi:MAG: transketolase [Legionellales bacterium]|nr:transketolase [Legionellales bacterium]|tara:strand:+ start:6192 stop:7025 length:834 start_codon:yes stop_codon:yes gene_type:complete
MSSAKVIERLEAMALRMRKNVLDMALNAGAGSSHFGGGLSIVDITATLFGEIMNIDPKNPEWDKRDRFILSKGHGVLGYYTALSEVGYITKEDLLNFEKDGGYLFGHPIMKRDKGIEFSNGSLGMGLSLGIGVALASKIKKNNCNVYVLMGDGECNEGSVWEGAMAGAQFNLNNLVAIIDRNNLQQTGSNDEIMSVGDVASKWKSFGWEVEEIDGHNISEIYKTLLLAKKFNGPFAIIAHTIKGKGFSFAENNNVWHHAPMTKSQYEDALLELEGKD